MAAAALPLGQVAPDSYVTASQFEVLDNGTSSPVNGATVTVAGARTQSDGMGVVQLPAGVLATSDLQTAVVTAPGYVPRTVQLLPGAAVKLTPIDSKINVLGAAGGTAINTAGNLQVIFPPGALAGDANVHVTQTYSRDLDPAQPIPSKINVAISDKADGSNAVNFAANAADAPFLGQYGYHLDLGGATLAPGTQVIVKFKTTGAFHALLQAQMNAGVPMDKSLEAITKDANGDIWVSMAVQGPSASSGVPATTVLTPASTLAKAFSILAVAGGSCQSYSDQIEHDTYVPAHEGGAAAVGLQSDWDNGRHDDNAQWGFSADYANSRASTNCTDGSGLPENTWITLMTHDSGYNGGNCVYFQFDPAIYACIDNKIWTQATSTTTYTTDNSQSENAHVTWASDDTRIGGTAVANGQVEFSVSQSSARQAPTVITTDSNGNASTIGLLASSGSASASYPSQPWTIPGSGGFSVNCGTIALTVTKNKPNVTLAISNNGTPTSQTVAWPTSLGAVSGSLSNPSFAPTMDLNTATEAVSVTGNQQPTNDSWLDVQSGAATIGWNLRTTIPTSAWWSKQVGVALTYASNDASVPADEQPATKWNGQTATGNVTFSHSVSGASNKPAARNNDQLSFQNVSSAATWGLNGTAGTARATHTSGAYTFSGSTSYTVDGGTSKPLGINANLPEIVFTVSGKATGCTMKYTLTRSDGQTSQLSMVLPAASGSDAKIHVFLPVNEPVGTAFSYTFLPTYIGSTDYNVTLPDGSFKYPAVTGIARGSSTSYTSLGTNTITAK